MVWDVRGSDDETGEKETVAEGKDRARDGYRGVGRTGRQTGKQGETGGQGSSVVWDGRQGGVRPPAPLPSQCVATLHTPPDAPSLPTTLCFLPVLRAPTTLLHNIPHAPLRLLYAP